MMGFNPPRISLATRIGTPVWVLRDNKVFERSVTRSEPWQLASGRWLVLVQGISGGYDLDRVRKREPDEFPSADRKPGSLSERPVESMFRYRVI